MNERDQERAKAREAPALDDPRSYLNRELSWLAFNERVLEEAQDESNPLLERVKFLAIHQNNLDEFFMTRVSGLRRQLAGGALATPPDGMSPAEQLNEIRQRVRPQLAEVARLWREELVPALRREGVHLLAYDELAPEQRRLLRRHFKSEIYPALTPLAFDPGHPFPHISNLSINLAVVVREPGGRERFARVKVPHVFPRLLRVPAEEKADRYERLGLAELSATNFVFIEDVVAANLDLLFRGMEVAGAFPFRITRDADLEIEEDEAADLLAAMQEVVGQRHFGSVVRLEADERMPKRIRRILISNLGLAPYQVYRSDGPLGLADLMELHRIDRPDLKDRPFLPHLPPALAGERDIFPLLRQRDVLLYHPYDSFQPVVDFVRQAAADPNVVAIKQTLYRVGPNSPVVEALMEARENGKQVAALVELKARFDEQNNIVWARALEEAGVHVVYGLVGLKVHAKICLVVRRERDGVRCYTHLGTGNYNPETARIYTDLGLLTSNKRIAADAVRLFNALTGYAKGGGYRKLIVAPHGMREALVGRIEREIDRHRRDGGGGRIAFKMNALVDPDCIRALYRASRAGVRVDLAVRGICCLRPGVPGLSENVRVVSVVGRFLEHARLYYFRNGGEEELLAGSADMMPRNLDGRVEVLFPIKDEALRTAVRDGILLPGCDDNVKGRELQADGHYVRRRPAADVPPIDSQSLWLTEPGPWHL